MGLLSLFGLIPCEGGVTQVEQERWRRSDLQRKEEKEKLREKTNRG